MTDSLDHALVAAAKRGSNLAFAQIVARHQAAVRGFLRRACGSWADAEDLAQETFVTAWRKIAAFAGESSLRSWLCGIAYRKCLEHARSRKRAGAREASFLDLNPEPQGERHPGDLMDLAQAMSALPLEQRAAVSLCLAQGFSHAEAASTLHLPLGTVKSHVLRGKAKLLEALGDEQS